VKEITERRLNWTMSVKLSIGRSILLPSFKKEAQANTRMDLLFSLSDFSVMNLWINIPRQIADYPVMNKAGSHIIADHSDEYGNGG
jgi:hypothetical protein